MRGKIEKIADEASELAREWAKRFDAWNGSENESSLFMGVVTESVPDVLRDYIDLPEGVGILLSHIVPGGPADKAGLKENDILVRFDDQLIVNMEQLSTLIDLAGADAEVSVEVIRKGQQKNFSLQLETKEKGKDGKSKSSKEPASSNGSKREKREKEVGAFFDSIQNWIPGFVRVYLDENEGVNTEFQELKKDLQVFWLRLEKMSSQKIAKTI